MSTIKWTLDPAHSEIQFKAKHLMITNVTGNFSQFSVNVETADENFNDPKIEFTATVASISTGNEQRDNHLKSADFFDVEKYPEIRFVSTKLENRDEDGFDLYGDLTIKETTKNIKLKVEFGGVAKDPWGNTKAGFTLSTKLNRADFGLTWNAVLETGGVLVSEEVKIAGEIQLVRS